jgi:hypothetical protein
MSEAISGKMSVPFLRGGNVAGETTQRTTGSERVG